MTIRLQGLAAPEHNDLGARAASHAMAYFKGKTMRCELSGDRNQDRCVAVCYLGEVDIQRQWCAQPSRRTAQHTISANA
jgi:endonuclease YncB( thermonuclease family)